MTHAVHLQGVPRQYAAALTHAIRHTLALAKAGPGSLTLRLTDEDELRRLNADFAHVDCVTDVLSFPNGDPDGEGTGTYFGDVVIAMPVAAAHAKSAGHDVQAELTLLAVHGTLHLFGHDHAHGRSRAAMWRRQDQILAELGCSIRSPRDDE